MTNRPLYPPYTPLPDPRPPLCCETGTMIRQNLPATLGIGYVVDAELPSGTIEVWRDGVCIGRIENIGLK